MFLRKTKINLSIMCEVIMKNNDLMIKVQNVSMRFNLGIEYNLHSHINKVKIFVQ